MANYIYTFSPISPDFIESQLGLAAGTIQVNSTAGLITIISSVSLSVDQTTKLNALVRAGKIPSVLPPVIFPDGSLQSSSANASPMKFRPAGRYHVNQYAAGTITNVALVTNTLYAIPFYVADPKTIIQMAIQVTTSKSGNARLGIYSNGVGTYPDGLLLDAGVVATGTNGLKELTGLSAALSGNSLYWLALVCSTNPSISGNDAQDNFPLLGFDGALNVVPSSSYQVAFTYAALPTPFPAGAAMVNADRIKIALMW